MNRKIISITIFLTLLISLCGCKSTPSPEGGASTTASQSTKGNAVTAARQSKTDGITTFALSPSSDGVDNFLGILGEVNSGYENDVCFNVTPQSITDEYGFSVFKFDKSCAGYLLYGNNIYPLCEWFGGLGVTSFAVADMNKDGNAELYFTYSWGSGVHRSLTGYFDSKSGKIVSFGYSHYDSDMVLVRDNNTLSLYAASVDWESFVDINLQAQEKIGDIVLESGKIQLSVTE